MEEEKGGAYVVGFRGGEDEGGMEFEAWSSQSSGYKSGWCLPSDPEDCDGEI